MNFLFHYKSIIRKYRGADEYLETIIYLFYFCPVFILMGHFISNSNLAFV